MLGNYTFETYLGLVNPPYKGCFDLRCLRTWEKAFHTLHHTHKNKP